MRRNEFTPEDLFAQINALDEALRAERVARTSAEARAQTTDEALAAASREFELALSTMSAMADLLLSRPQDEAERHCSELLRVSAKNAATLLGAESDRTMFDGVPFALEDARGAALGRLYGRALVVEDNAANQVLIGAYLDAFGLTYHCAASGEAALAALKATRFDVVLMDIAMPGMDGLATTRRIRSLAGASCRSAIIALTANAIEGDRERCVAAGMNGYLAKPILGRDLYETLALHLSPAGQRAAG